MSEEEIKAQLRRFLCSELLHRPGYPLGDDTPLISGGLLDSHALVQLSVFLEQTFSIYIPDADFSMEKMDTLAAITDQVTAAKARQ